MPVFITPTKLAANASNASWTDKDLSAIVPASAVAVILHIHKNVNSTSTHTIGVRKNGSTDATAFYLAGVYRHLWAVIGLDSSRIFELTVTDKTITDVYVVGYFTSSEMVSFTNQVEVAPSHYGSWRDIDITAHLTGGVARAACLYFNGFAANSAFGVRKNGSTDNRTKQTSHATFAMVAVDSGDIFETNIGSSSDKLYLQGYLTGGVVLYTNGISRSVASDATWLDLTALNAAAIGGIYHLFPYSGYYCGIRKNGSAEDIYAVPENAFGLVECDSAGGVEYKVQSKNYPTYEMGYFVRAGGAGNFLLMFD